MWNYYGDEPSNPLSSNSKCFQYKSSITGNTYDGDDDANKVGKNETKITIQTFKEFLENFVKYTID